MMSLKAIFLFALPLAASFFYACTSAEENGNRLEVNKKYTLESWPDKNYIDELDSILKAEPLKQSADSERTALTIYSGAMPTITLPGKKSATRPSLTEKRTGRTGRETANASQNAERFADNFMKALSTLQSDPSNASKYRTFPARADEDIFALLSRAYKSDATKLPKFYTLSALQSVNPNVRLEHLAEGDKVRIPVLP